MNFKIDPIYILAIIALLVVIYVAISYTSTPVASTTTVSAPIVQTVGIGDIIKVDYTGTFTNGTQFDSSIGNGKQPLQFVVGSGQLIKGFDQGVIGMKLNEERTITAPANDAYGERNSALIEQVPINAFGNRTIQVGTTITRSTEAQQIQGFVTAVNSTTVTVDFNPPLAGLTLIFKIKVLEIQKKK